MYMYLYVGFLAVLGFGGLLALLTAAYISKKLGLDYYATMRGRIVFILIFAAFMLICLLICFLYLFLSYD